MDLQDLFLAKIHRESGLCPLGSRLGLTLSGTVDVQLANPARSGRKQRQPVWSCCGSLALF